MVFMVVVVGELVATRAVESLEMAAAVGLPVVVLHALFRIRDDLLIAEESTVNGDETAASAVVEKEKEREKREEGVDLEAPSHGD